MRNRDYFVLCTIILFSLSHFVESIFFKIVMISLGFIFLGIYLGINFKSIEYEYKQKHWRKIKRRKEIDEEEKDFLLHLES